MPLIDERARLFGKVNFLDAIVGILALALVPLGYGAFVLFREPAPTIVSVQPTRMMAGEASIVQIAGQNLRPFLRARVGTTDSPRFALQSPSLGEITVPANLPPGVYDLALYDEHRELIRVSQALTVFMPPAPPAAVVQVVGAFLGLSTDDAQRLRVGSRFPHADPNPTAEILALGTPEPVRRRVRVGGSSVVATSTAGDGQVPAILRLRCEIANDQCRVGDTALAPDSVLLIPKRPSEPSTSPRKSDPADFVSFLGMEVRSADAPPEWPAPPPSTIVQAVGTFLGLSKDVARLIRAGAKFPRDAKEPTVEILSAEAPERGMQRLRVSGSAVIATPGSDDVQLTATIRLRCQIYGDQCRVGDTALAQDATITLPLRAGLASEGGDTESPDHVNFWVTAIRSADASLVATPTTTTPVQAVGVLMDLEPDEAQRMHVGVRFPQTGADALAEILAVGSPEPGIERLRVGGNAIVTTPSIRTMQMPAIVRLRCQMVNEQCRIGDTVLSQDAVVALPDQTPTRGHAAGSSVERDHIRFLVKEVRAANAHVAFPSVTTAVAMLRVRFVVRPELVDLVKVGDVDIGSPVTTTAADKASLIGVEPERQTLTALGNVDATPGRSFQMQQTVVAFTGAIRAPVTQGRSGWQYKDKPVKVGAPFAFETTAAFMEGSILEMTVGSLIETPVR